MTSMLGYHRRNTHYAHDQENSKEDDCDYQYRHSTPLIELCFADEPATVMPITGRCEDARKGQTQSSYCAHTANQAGQPRGSI